MEKSERFASYSPQRRTALVLSGTGAHGAYHAGVLRAFQEAGVKLDILAGHGVGAAGAALAAIDGAARLWETDGVWQSDRAPKLYGWKGPVRIAAWVTAAAALPAGAALLLPAIGIMPTAWSATLLLALVAAAVVAVVAIARRTPPTRRRAEGGWWWRLAAAPIDAEAARDLFRDVVWALIRGAAPAARPSRAALGRRYSEVLRENLGQPGFRELVLVATDVDARRDIVAALLADPWRSAFLAPKSDGDRQSDVLDLTGADRDHAFDVVAAALTPPLICDPELVTFAVDGFWRGETHRFCDRPGSVNRLLEEVAAAGATQAIVVSALSLEARPHRLRVSRLDLRSRLGEFQSAAEAAALRDALQMARLRFDGVYLVCPAHNAIAPFDLRGAYDEASDRRQSLQELMARGFEDAGRQFIEPIVGASGDQLARTEPARGAAAGLHAKNLLDDIDPARIRDLN